METSNHKFKKLLKYHAEKRNKNQGVLYSKCGKPEILDSNQREKHIT